MSYKCMRGFFDHLVVSVHFVGCLFHLTRNDNLLSVSEYSCRACSNFDNMQLQFAPKWLVFKVQTNIC